MSQNFTDIYKSDILNLLFKNYLGLTYTGTNQLLSSEATNGGLAVPNILLKNIWTQEIPTTAPTDLSLVETNSYYKKYISKSNPHIFKYENLNLKTDDGYSYRYRGTNDDTITTNLLRDAIPSNYDPKNSYEIIVYDLSGTNPSSQIHSNNTDKPWTIDIFAGHLTFFKQQNTATFNPSITFWRYEGTRGNIPTSNTSNEVSASAQLNVSVLTTPSASTIYRPLLVDSSGVKDVFIDTRSNYLSYDSYTGSLTCQILNAASDIKIKQDIKELSLDYATNLLSRLNPVDYKFINDTTKKRFGFIAQEVEDEFKTESLGLHYKQIGANGQEQHFLSYLELISPIIKVVNSLVEDIKVLKAEIKELKNL